MVRVSIESPARLAAARPARSRRAIASPCASTRPQRPRAHATFSRSAASTSLWSLNVQCPVADDLAGFVTLAGDQQHVAGLRAPPRRRGSPRGDRRFRARSARGAPSMIAARIVAGFSLRGLSSVTMTRSACLAAIAPINGALALVAVAAGAEHDDELAFDVRPQRLDGFLQRVRLVRVVDEHRRAVALADQIEPSLGAFERSQRRENRDPAHRRSQSQDLRQPARSRPGSRRPAAAAI